MSRNLNKYKVSCGDLIDDVLHIKHMYGAMRYKFGHFELDSRAMVLSENSRKISVEPQIYTLIELLVKNHDRIVSKDEIREYIWGGRIVSDAALNSRLKSARKLLGDSGKLQVYIKTIPNVGLKFIADVEIIDPSLKPLSETVEPSVRAASKAKLHWYALALAIILIGFFGFVFSSAGGFTHVGNDNTDPYLIESFTIHENQAIVGFNTLHLENHTRAQCMEACLNESRFVCKSFDYFKGRNICDLSDMSMKDTGGLKSNYENDPYDHYARIFSEATE